ncbi:MAG: signal recognition particle protein [Clostridia bacterium]|nr:signal recognition particle protein [Clostridia bacterium]MBQ2327445.1 signal recognition particle protein [Clostridia bacterium]
MAFENLADKLSGVFKKLRSKGRLSESDVKEAMREIRMALLEADVNFKVAKDFVAKVSEKAVGAEILESLSPAQQVIKIVNEELVSLMGGTQNRIRMANNPPTVIMFVGLQGAGKTTNCAKLAGYFKKRESRRPLLCACDVYRPAAIEQLKVVGAQLDIPVFEQGQGDPVEIAKAAYDHAKLHGNDVLIIDTAGRLHIDEQLMDELKSIKANVKPHEIMLVVDGMTGQDAVNAASAFNDALGIDSILISKLDGDARGGAALSIRAVTGKPIKFCGVGEKLDQIEPFYPDRMASRILGMGDVLTFIEKAQQNFDEKKAVDMEARLRKGKLNLNDYYDQLVQMKSMGSMDEIMGMIPGMNAQALKGAKVDEKALAKVEAIILSMTPKERENPDLLNFSRKKRIAAGCGQRVEDVNRLLKQLDMTQKMMKQFTGVAKRQGKRKGGFKLPF